MLLFPSEQKLVLVGRDRIMNEFVIIDFLLSVALMAFDLASVLLIARRDRVLKQTVAGHCVERC